MVERDGNFGGKDKRLRIVRIVRMMRVKAIEKVLR